MDFERLNSVQPNVEIARERGSRIIVRDDVWLVFERHVRMRWLLVHRHRVWLPRLSAVERASHENSVSCGIVSPVLRSSQLVESDVAENRVAANIVGQGDVSRDVVVRGRSAGRELPVRAAVLRIGDFRGRLKSRCDLLRIVPIDGYRRLIEEARARGDRNHLRAGGSGQRLLAHPLFLRGLRAPPRRQRSRQPAPA